MIIFGLSIWLWLFVSVFVTIGVFAYEQDNSVFSGGGVLAAALGLQFIFGVPVWQSIVENPATIFLWLIGHFVIGALYSILWKWRNYVKKNTGRSKEQFERFKKTLEGDDVKRAEELFLSSTSYNGLHPSNHVSKFTNWILFWPFGLLWSLLHDPVTWVARTTYELMGSAYRKISDDIVRKSL